MFSLYFSMPEVYSSQDLDMLTGTAVEVDGVGLAADMEEAGEVGSKKVAGHHRKWLSITDMSTKFTTTTTMNTR